MATTAVGNITPETLITLKVSLNDGLKKLKLPLKDLNAWTLPAKLRQCLHISPGQTVVFERYSDSAGGFIALDAASVPAYKALNRAAKAKGKLRIKAIIMAKETDQEQGSSRAPPADALRAVPQSVNSLLVPPPPPAYQDEEQQQSSTDSALAQAFNTALTSVQSLSQPTDLSALCNIPYPSSMMPNMPSCGAAMYAVPGTGYPYINTDTQRVKPSQQVVASAEEAPTPQPFTAKVVSQESLASTLAFRTRDQKSQASTVQAAWSVYCNICDSAMLNAHYHCSTCDNGDYDLCESCVSKGHLCPGVDHWLIKRFVQDGKVVSSITERVGRTFTKPAENKAEMPGTFDVKLLKEEPRPQHASLPARTCNNCVVVLPDREFVNCNVCKDFDLCMPCHIANNHGHHPGHDFSPAVDNTTLSLLAQTLLKSGRNVKHNAFCDGCDKKIIGIRHKCFNCPDWDYCSDCFRDAATKHPQHRFAAIYEQLQDPRPNNARHHGVFCDGPLCNDKSPQTYIQGVRYKCAVCHDTDFCANCEAHPDNMHNRTHPMIKFKTHVRNVNVHTLDSRNDGHVQTLGDIAAAVAEPIIKTENTEIPVQTMAEIAPTEVKTTEIKTYGQPKDGDVSVAPFTAPATMLNAIFIRDSVADGTVMSPGACFTQVWTLRNEGPYVWPAGCSVRFTGGDNMLNVENGHPSAVASIAQASESSVVGREVQVGEEIAFKITLKAPLREGRSISYWRLKSADGIPFGHRLWCDINVKGTKPINLIRNIPITGPAKDAATEPAKTLSIRDAMSRLDAMSTAGSAKALSVRDAMTRLDALSTAEPAKALSVRDAMTRLDALSTAEPAKPLSVRDAMNRLDSLSTPEQLDAQRIRLAKKSKKKNFLAPANTTSTRNTFDAFELMMLEQHNNERQRLAKENSERCKQAASRYKVAVEEQGQAPVQDEESRREQARERVDAIKGMIEKQRAQRREMLQSNTIADADVQTSSPADVAATFNNLAAGRSTTEEQTVEAANESTSSSQMIFPKLDKESPASSIIEANKGKAATVETEDGEIIASAAPSIAATADLDHAVISPTDGDFDDLEVLSISGASDDDDSDDDGFLTDEEYDILDASDRETVASP